MPIYTYQCEKCKAEFEAIASIQKKDAGWQPVCPKCGSPQTHQTFKAMATLVGTRRSPSGGGCCSPSGR